MSAHKYLKIFVLAGESSGDYLAGKLIAYLKKIDPNIQFSALGGTEVEAAGVSSIFPMQHLAVMGITDVLKRLKSLRQCLNMVENHIRVFDPDIVVTVDLPGFNFRLVKRCRKFSKARFIHYVAPTVWAWKPWRARQAAALFDHMLVILPFEPPYFTRHGLKTHHIGYAITEDMHTLEAKKQGRSIGILPGSRPSEIRRHMPLLHDCASILKRRLGPADRPTMSILAADKQRPLINQLSQDWPLEVKIIDSSAKASVLGSHHINLSVSGMISLESIVARTPVIVCYRSDPLTTWIAKRMVKVRYANLVNILADKQVIPEYIAQHCKPEAIVTKMIEWLNHPQQAKRSLEQAHRTITKAMSGPAEQTPSQAAANIILSYA